MQGTFVLCYFFKFAWNEVFYLTTKIVNLLNNSSNDDAFKTIRFFS